MTIRRLPIVRGNEVQTFLPGAVIGLTYDATFRGLVPLETRLDGIPVRNETLGRTLLHVPAFALDSVTRTDGAGARFGSASLLEFRTLSGTGRWTGYARGLTDQSMPGTIGNARVEAGATGGAAKGLRLSAHGSWQRADATEFNNVGDVDIYENAGVDTILSYDPTNGGGGQLRDVPIMAFRKADKSIMPASKWDDASGVVRLGYEQSALKFFAALYGSQLRLREPLGGGACCALYNAAAQRADVESAMTLSAGVDAKLGSATLQVRLARSTNKLTKSVVSGAGWDLLVDDETFPVTDELIRRVLANDPDGVTPFPTHRTDLNTGLDYRSNPYGVLDSYTTRGVANGAYTYADESSMFASALLSKEAGVHNVTVGAEMRSFETAYVETGFNTAAFMSLYREKPRMVSAFLEERVHLSKAILSAGARLVNYNPNTKFSSTPGYNTDATFVQAKTRSAIVPRLALEVPLEKAQFYVGAGQTATPVDYHQQFRGKNMDFFRFRNTNTSYVFNEPLDLVKVAYGNAGFRFDVTPSLVFRAEGYWSEGAMLGTARPQFEDPTNPGATTYLTVVALNDSVKTVGGAGMVEYKVAARTSLQLAASYESLEHTNANIIAGAKAKTKTVNAFYVASLPAALGSGDVTLALRARSPIEYLEFYYDDFHTESTSWLTHFDARAAKTVKRGTMSATLFVEGLRLLGSKPFQNVTADDSYVSTARYTVGGGQALNNINLTSMETAGPGLRNDIDLYYLRQAEKRFGNGDGQFSGEEQIAAFSASSVLRQLATSALSQTRRVQMGVQLSF